MRLLILLPILILGACAAPDISAFKQSTFALTTSLDENQTKLVSSGKTIVTKFGDPADQPDDALKQQLEDMIKNVSDLNTQGKQVRAITLVLATYTSSVARMARAGKDGEDAASELKSNIETTISTLTGDETLLPDSITTFSGAIADVVQLGKNKELYEIMEDVKGEIGAIATALETIGTSEIGIVDSLEKFWRTERPDLSNHHSAYMMLEKKLGKIDHEAKTEFSFKLTACANDPDNCDVVQLSENRTAELATQVAEIGKIQAIIEILKPYEEAYQAWDKEIRDWRTETEKHVTAIPSLAVAWRSDHEEIIEYLKSCTGLGGVFDKKCGAFSADNLQLLGKLVGGALLPF